MIGTGRIEEVVILFLVSFSQSATFAYSSDVNDSCYTAALQWIRTIETEKKDVLEKHALSGCAFSKKWIERYNGTSEASRESLCTDLVLIWTHKECMYFRDSVSPEAYDPCKTWSREMYTRCMEYEDEWFGE
ncbi:hypothetical protein [Desulfopila aestuarii]|uniref:hypothetical protein n=1 Tax=Desulfopila aestuarii TaxID=231440 RepID=UPI0011613328|nr:hypothetical protein [Desulfopila aestuarii]